MMSKVNLINQSEYARHRGVSKVAVGKAIRAGRISLVNGKIDQVVADIQWAANSRARAGSGGSEQLTLQAPALPIEVDKPDDYVTMRNRREAAEAELAELRLAEEKSQLIRVDAVKAAVSNVFSATRDALLQIPARLGSQLAAVSDAAAAQTMLHSEIHQALQLLAVAADQFATVSEVTT